MPSEAHVLSLSTRSLGSVPRAVWIGGGLLGLVTAALAGALVMRSVDHAPTPLAAMPAVTSPADVRGQPVPPTALAEARPALSSAPARHLHHSKSSATANTAGQTSWSAPGGTTQAALCSHCGTVESVSSVQQKGQGTGLGVVAGGLLGGVAGHQMGGGKGKTAMTVLGAIGGGFAGNEVEKRARGETLFNVQVRMEDGSTRVFKRPQSMAIGTHVVVDGSTLRVAQNSGNADAPRTMRTSAPVDGST